MKQRPPTAKEVANQAVLMAKEEMRIALIKFSQTPAGRIVKEVGKEVTEARNQGRELTPLDLADFALRIPQMMRDYENGE